MTKKRSNQPQITTPLGIFIALRLIVPLVIFSNPLLGIIASLILDGIDYRILVRLCKYPHLKYELYDKLLDFYWYMLILIYIIFINISIDSIILFSVLFIIRLCGEIIFSLSKQEGVLLFFPNLIEPVFWAWVLIPPLQDHLIYIASIGFLLLPIKLLQEYTLHIRRYDVIDHLSFLPKKLFLRNTTR